MERIEDMLEEVAKRRLRRLIQEPNTLGSGPTEEEHFLAIYTLFKSSRKLENLTRSLISVTVALFILTAVLVVLTWFSWISSLAR